MALDPVPVHVRGRVGLRDLEERSLARLARADHRGEDPERAEQRPAWMPIEACSGM
jgi:hypothetical protein